MFLRALKFFIHKNQQFSNESDLCDNQTIDVHYRAMQVQILNIVCPFSLCIQIKTLQENRNEWFIIVNAFFQIA